MPILCNKPYPQDSVFNSVFETYPYPLSDFQKYAIEAIVEGHHVLSCAHTGSGKTLAAEFAIQHFVKQGKKVIYTSPIKALSNQKYYEFTKKYPHISFGLLTGDIKTNPTADVLIMTTEILMNKLFLADVASALTFDMDIQNELSCVIFDEVHYINDNHRGQVWEQSILMLPPHIQMVMLSATIDNPYGFAQWCEKPGDNKQVWLATTDYRVVPLTHYLYFATTEDPFKKIKDKAIQQQIRDASHKFIPIRVSTGEFLEKSYHQIKNVYNLFQKERIYIKRKFVLNRLAEQLKEADMLPAIAFVFSRKHVELCAKDMTTNLQEFDTKVPYTMRRECEQIVRKFPNYQEYLELPEYNELVALLEKGVGIHHSGMIPVLREIVEIMISKKHIKLLFATESFAIGLDCPIRTAIFTSLTKYDNAGQRSLHSHEYTQMAGRAGRRGIDTIGHVIHCNNLFDPPTYAEYTDILGGKPQKLVSKFRVSYSTVLSLLKNGNKNITELNQYIQKSMVQTELNSITAATKSRINTIQTDLHIKQTNLTNSRTPEDILKRYVWLQENLSMLTHKKRKEAEREMADYKDAHKFLEKDIYYYKEYMNLQTEYGVEQNHLEYTSNYMKTQINQICKLLQGYKMIELSKKVDPDGTICWNWALTTRGKIAANLAEIHPVLASIVIEETAYFKELSCKEIVAFLSCFTNIRADEEHPESYPSFGIPQKLKNLIQHTTVLLEEIQDKENAFKVETGIDYDDILQYHLLNEMDKWCDATTELECKQIIQIQIKEKGISIGDFVKAILKIATVAREVSSVCELTGEIECMNKLNEVDGLILKYITTAQSLYI